MANPDNITWHHSSITRDDRSRRNGHQGCVLWFTGLSGSGKSTLAFAVEQELFKRQLGCYVLDGDNIRHGISSDLGFSAEDRTENIRRVAEVSKLFLDAGLIVLSAFISPDEKDRSMARSLFSPEDYVEIYVKCSLAECERRDPKGLYKKARKGEIPNFTGVTAQYDVPAAPDLVVDTEHSSLAESVQLILDHLERKKQVFTVKA